MFSIIAYARRMDTHFKLLREDCDQALRRAQEAPPTVGARELKALAQAGLLEDFIDSVLAPMFARHFQRHGWSIELPCSLHEALDALVEGKVRLPDDYLRAVFPSFWHAACGPAARAADEAFWEKVLRYPCGLNSTGEVYDEITLATMRRSCRVQRKSVSWFSAAKALGVYEDHLDSTQKQVRIWDPSGGFGARMLGAAAWSRRHNVSVVYMACEPAKMTFADLGRLGSALERLSGHRFSARVSPRGSEHGGPGGTPCDFIFTSPPYFNIERYFDEPGQCWRDYPKWSQWREKYLLPTAEGAKAALRPGGKLVLNVRKKEMSAWWKAIGSGVQSEAFAVKAGPFERKRGQDNLNEKLLVWEKP